MNISLTESERIDGLSGDRLALALRHLRDFGLVVVENAYEPGFVETVKTQFDALASDYVESRGGWEKLTGNTFGEKHIGFFPPLFGPIADSSIVAHPAAVSILNAALGGDPKCSFFHTNTCFPGSGFQPVHRDQKHLFEGETDTILPVSHIVLNIPLVAFTEENGATQFWPGTHRLPDRDNDDIKAWAERAEGMPSIRTILPVGSLVLRDLRAWHRGTPNNSDHARAMLAIVYNRSFVHDKTGTIPRTTWESWTKSAQKIFDRNRVVDDSEHKPRTWGENA